MQPEPTPEDPQAPQRPGRPAFMAPWRITYILGPKDKDCFMCRAATLPDGDEAAWKQMLLLHRSAHGLVIMNRYPYTGGHLLIAPLRHTADLPGLSSEESAYLWELTRVSIDVITKVLKPQGHNLGMNLGKAAGAGVEEHLHMHALPRWIGDTNFIHVLDNTSCIPIALEEVWDAMRPHFKAY